MISEKRETLIENLWDDAYAAPLSPEALLLYRSNLLGSDKRITNFAGGNTSAKLRCRDPLTGADTEVLWVKGSGGDLGSMKLDGFATLYMEKLHGLKMLYRGAQHEDEMVGYLPHCTFNLNQRAASIDTPLHAYIDRAHVDHMHPDAVIALAATDNSRALTEEIFGGEIGWLPWRRPGFELGLMLEEISSNNPHFKGAVLASHGLFTWGDTAEACYETTLAVINRAAVWLATKTESVAAFGGNRHRAMSSERRASIAAHLMPAIRGKISSQEKKVGHFNDDPRVLEFVDARNMRELAALGTSCPDHFLRTKIKPMVLDFDPAENDLTAVCGEMDEALDGYRAEYTAYYDRCKHSDSPAIRDPHPVVYLVPGVGMMTFAKDKATARIAGEFYVNAINVMRGATAVDTYVGLVEQEAFDIEYWRLEEAKLQRMPRPKSLAGRVALIAGGAGGIGRAIATRYLREGCCVVLSDVDQTSLDATRADLADRFSPDQVRAAWIDVAKEDTVRTAFERVAVEYGGLDILVSSAGIASSAPLEETSLSHWQRSMDILSTGYFLVSREAFKLFKRQGHGGAVVFIVSKNGLVASPNASAYCAAKAAEIQLARCMALEGAECGIRVNVVNPDAVLKGSKIWSGEWKRDRAAAYGLAAEDLDEHYRNRSLLKLSVHPEDVAEAAYFLASDMSAKSTGNVVNVDAGHVAAFTR